MAHELLKVQEKDAVRVPWHTLRQQAYSILQAVNVPDDHAGVTADILIQADLFGVDSHGSGNVVGYATQIQKGVYTVPQKIQTLSESPSAALISNGNGLGFVGAHAAMKMAMEKAHNTGMAGVTVRDGHHIGMAGYYPLMAVRQDMIGLAATNASNAVRPAQGLRAKLGTNPISFGAPAGKERPFLFDAATSTVASGKIGLARRYGVKMPVGWAIDSEGDPVTDPPEGRSDGWSMNPLGNTREQGAHKGYGFSMMVEILCGVLSGGGFSSTLRPGENHTFCAALDISKFRDLDEFKAMMDELIQDMHSTPPEHGVSRVLVAGDPEFDNEAERSEKGIPLHKTLVASIAAKAKEVGAEVLI